MKLRELVQVLAMSSILVQHVISQSNETSAENIREKRTLSHFLPHLGNVFTIARAVMGKYSHSLALLSWRYSRVKHSNNSSEMCRPLSPTL